MRTQAAGFTLLEVLVALVVITVGLLGLLGTLGPIAALAGKGRAQGRAAQILASRADLLRAMVMAGAPACNAPSGGSQVHPEGMAESWTVSALPGAIQVQVVAGTDTLLTRFPCP